MDIVTILTQKNLVTPDQVTKAQADVESTGVTIEQALLKQGVSPVDILHAKGEYLEIPTRSLDNFDVSTKVLEYLPQESAEHYRVVPLAVTDNVLEVGMVDPDDILPKQASRSRYFSFLRKISIKCWGYIGD